MPTSDGGFGMRVFLMKRSCDFSLVEYGKLFQMVTLAGQGCGLMVMLGMIT
jgi:hypothetical protein